MKTYRQRWLEVEKIEKEELRQASIEQRWQQLNSILRLAIGLGLPLNEDKDEEVITRRWARLRGDR